MNNSKFLILLIPVCLILVLSCAPATTPSSASDTQGKREVTATEIHAAPAEANTADTPVPAQEDVANTWEIIHELEIEHATTVAGFLNDVFGLTAGYAGEVHYTTDGGETWPRASNGSMCRFGLDIVDENLAWHVGNGGQVRMSTDGGQTWEAVPSLADHGINPFISFIDAKIGWAASDKQLWSTADGGQTWMEITPPEDVKNFIEISLRSANDGYLIDATGVLYTTHDGGQHWSAQTLELNDMTPLGVAHGAAIRFFDADQGLVIMSLVGDGTNKVVAMRTADAGQTWTQEDLPVPMGQLYLAHDGTTLTVVDFMKVGKVTVLSSNTSPLAMTRSN